MRLVGVALACCVMLLLVTLPANAVRSRVTTGWFFHRGLKRVEKVAERVESNVLSNLKNLTHITGNSTNYANGTLKAPRDCVMGEWSKWSSCTHGMQHRTRSVEKKPVAGGAPCGAHKESRTCETTEKVDCKVSSWSNFGTCVADASLNTAQRDPSEMFWHINGTRSRTRTIVHPARNGGKPCPDSLTDPVNCIVNKKCQVSPWGLWSSCGPDVKSQTRERSIDIHPSGDAAKCPNLHESRHCAHEKCEMSGWSDWSVCEGGKQRRNRTIKKDGINEECPETEETRDCVDVIDCVLAPWSAWSACEEEHSKQNRTRAIATPASATGKACPSATSELRREIKKCVECTVTKWSVWSPCHNGTHSRKRSVHHKPVGHVSPCPVLSQTEDCSMPVDCQVSAFGIWSECEAGKKIRSRTVTTPAANGGKDCPHLEEHEACTLGGAGGASSAEAPQTDAVGGGMKTVMVTDPKPLVTPVIDNGNLPADEVIESTSSPCQCQSESVHPTCAHACSPSTSESETSTPVAVSGPAPEKPSCNCANKMVMSHCMDPCHAKKQKESSNPSSPLANLANMIKSMIRDAKKPGHLPYVAPVPMEDTGLNSLPAGIKKLRRAVARKQLLRILGTSRPAATPLSVQSDNPAGELGDMAQGLKQIEKSLSS